MERKRRDSREEREKSRYVLGQGENRCKVITASRCKSYITFYINFDVSQHPPPPFLRVIFSAVSTLSFVRSDFARRYMDFIAPLAPITREAKLLFFILQGKEWGKSEERALKALFSQSFTTEPRDLSQPALIESAVQKNGNMISNNGKMHSWFAS